jgi:hypothetical protein
VASITQPDADGNKSTNNLPGGITTTTITYPSLTAAVNLNRTYTNGTPLTVGEDTAPTISNITGYTWRIQARSTVSTGAPSTTRNSIRIEEVAFRTILTYQMFSMSATNGQLLGQGDQLWIRGGDGIGSNSVPGFPLSWSDNFTSLGNGRAGIRLLQMESNGYNNGMSGNNTNATSSIWRWVTWEVNTTAYVELMLGRHATAAASLTTGENTYVNEAWQYGPRFWAYQRGGWSPAKEEYYLVPGKHRWIRITNANFTQGGNTNFTSLMNFRSQPAVTYTQPSP